MQIFHKSIILQQIKKNIRKHYLSSDEYDYNSFDNENVDIQLDDNSNNDKSLVNSQEYDCEISKKEFTFGFPNKNSICFFNTILCLLFHLCNQEHNNQCIFFGCIIIVSCLEAQL